LITNIFNSLLVKIIKIGYFENSLLIIYLYIIKEKAI
jgi:hypothetical protein